MSKVSVAPGICGLRTTIDCYVDDSYQASVTIESDCAQVSHLADRLGQISVFDELRAPLHESTIYREAGACRLHTACPVPSAILKAIEVAAGLALPADVHVAIER
ncbi:MAG: DUF6951 family protein [Anaerolineae bacterium]